MNTPPIKRYIQLSLVIYISLLSGCQGYESSIPDRAAYVKRNIYTEKLNSSGSYLYISTPKSSTERIGFGGILIVHAFDENYYAFDLACPVEANATIRIGKPDLSLICKCDSCGERYDLGLGLGTPLNNISKEGLKRYTVSLDESNNIFVTR